MPINSGYYDAPVQISRVIDNISRRAVDGTVDETAKYKLANTSDSSAISDTASETNFSTTRTLSSSLWKVGGIFRLTASGVYSTTGTPTLTFRVKLGSTNVVVFTAKTGINNASNQSWLIEADIVCRTTGSSGTIMGYGRIHINTSAGVDTSEVVINSSTTSINTTANQILQISLTWSAASTSNTATMKNYILGLLNY